MVCIICTQTYSNNHSATFIVHETLKNFSITRRGNTAQTCRSRISVAGCLPRAELFVLHLDGLAWSGTLKHNVVKCSDPCVLQVESVEKNLSNVPSIWNYMHAILGMVSQTKVDIQQGFKTSSNQRFNTGWNGWNQQPVSTTAANCKCIDAPSSSFRYGLKEFWSNKYAEAFPSTSKRVLSVFGNCFINLLVSRSDGEHLCPFWFGCFGDGKHVKEQPRANTTSWNNVNAHLQCRKRMSYMWVEWRIYRISRACKLFATKKWRNPPKANHPQRCVQCWQNPGWSPIFEAIGNCERKETYLTHPAPKHTHTDDPLAVWQFGICIAQAPLPSCSCILLRVLLGDG